MSDQEGVGRRQAGDAFLTFYREGDGPKLILLRAWRPCAGLVGSRSEERRSRQEEEE